MRETVDFCALLRLDAKDPGIKDTAGKRRFVKHVLQTMELTDIENIQVGSYEEGGLSFEQRKRLAIACELAGKFSFGEYWVAWRVSWAVLHLFNNFLILNRPL